MKKLLIIATAIALTACGSVSRNIEYRCTGYETSEHSDDSSNRIRKDRDYKVINIFIFDSFNQIKIDDYSFTEHKPSQKDFFQKKGSEMTEIGQSSKFREYQYWFDVNKKTLNYKKSFSSTAHDKRGYSFAIESEFSGTCVAVK